MNTQQSTSQRASHILAVLMLALLYIGQPALAFVAAGTTAAPCQADGQECCCVAEVEIVEPSCCSSKSADEPEPSEQDDEGCDCRVGSGELPDQAPAVPHSGAEASLGNWIRDHAKQSALVAFGADAVCVVAHAGDDPVPRHAPRNLAGQVSSVGAWQLLTRGVAGFLAMLAVARV